MGLVNAKVTRIVWPPNRRQKLEVIAPPVERVNCSKFDSLPPHVREQLEQGLAKLTDSVHELHVDSKPCSSDIPVSTQPSISDSKLVDR